MSSDKTKHLEIKLEFLKFIHETSSLVIKLSDQLDELKIALLAEIEKQKKAE